MKTADQIIKLAQDNINKGSMKSSSQLCLSDAINLMKKGEEEKAKLRALKSLAYSVGIFHQDYIHASK